VSTRAGARGFTLLEVMVALAVLAGAMMALADLTGNALRNFAYARDLSVATVLARGKMAEVTERLTSEIAAEQEAAQAAAAEAGKKRDSTPADWSRRDRAQFNFLVKQLNLLLKAEFFGKTTDHLISHHMTLDTAVTGQINGVRGIFFSQCNNPLNGTISALLPLLFCHLSPLDHRGTNLGASL